MTQQPPVSQDPTSMAARRASARRTALIFALVAFAVYVGFIALNAVAS